MTFQNAKGEKTFVALAENGTKKRTGFGKTEELAKARAIENM